MLSFLFEQYGYYPNEFQNNEFWIGNWKFKLIEVWCDEEYVKRIDCSIEVIRGYFGGKGAYIIKTKQGKMISSYSEKKFVLVSVFDECVLISDLNKMNSIFKDVGEKVDLEKILNMWILRNEEIEKKGIASIRQDGKYYNDNMRVIMFSLGLCQNAIQYLKDTIEEFGSDVFNISLSHKRLKNLDSFDFFNPFNLILDYPARDVIDLYRNDFFSFEEFENNINVYEIDVKIASILMARMLYPVVVFDIIEENIAIKEKGLKLNFSIYKEFIKIKNVYLFFRKKYNIRPIIWLE